MVARKASAPVMGTEDDVAKGIGTSAVPIQKDLRWNCDVETADRICNYNRHYAEYAGYWELHNLPEGGIQRLWRDHVLRLEYRKASSMGRVTAADDFVRIPVPRLAVVP